MKLEKLYLSILESSSEQQRAQEENKLGSSAAQECRAFPSYMAWHKVVPTLRTANADCVVEMKECTQSWFCYWHPNQNKNFR